MTKPSRILPTLTQRAGAGVMGGRPTHGSGEDAERRPTDDLNDKGPIPGRMDPLQNGGNRLR